jgi:hypothetical protein
VTRAQLSASLASWRRREDYRRRKWKAAKRGTAQRRKWLALLREAKAMVERREKQIAASRPLRLRAYDEAVKLIGVMESGGNNRGPVVDRIIRANGGSGPEPWCGDYMAYVYRLAGSKTVVRAWAAVRFIGYVTGQSIVSKPAKGDMVCFKFDHVGMFVRDLGGGYIETIEGNTGASGATSDSSTGGDGVYRKRRHKSLVSRYVRVHR